MERAKPNGVSNMGKQVIEMKTQEKITHMDILKSGLNALVSNIPVLGFLCLFFLVAQADKTGIVSIMGITAGFSYAIGAVQMAVR